jgi:hypothetical protein
MLKPANAPQKVKHAFLTALRAGYHRYYAPSNYKNGPPGLGLTGPI